MSDGPSPARWTDTTARAVLRNIFDAAVASADPAAAVLRHLPAKPKGRCVVIGAGKASVAMAAALDAAWGDVDLSGLVVTRHGQFAPAGRIEVIEASHPTPNANSEEAGRRILAAVKGLTADDLVVALMSGGGSSLMVLPAGEMIYDGADAVMLSAESATGQYPREAVAMMSRIIESTERHKMYRSIINASQPGEEETAPHAVAAAAADLAKALRASVIVAFTSSGTTAARIARKRPKVSILAITPDVRTSRRLCLLWGAHSVLSRDVNTYEEMVDRATKTAITEQFAHPTNSIVVVAGIPFGEAGSTNNLRVVRIA